MKVTIAIKGRFHAFDLARELQQQNCLKEIITTYPVFETVKYGINKNNINSLVVYEILERLWRCLPWYIRQTCDIRYIICKLFDRHVSKLLTKDTDIFVGWSSSSLYSIRRSKQFGTKTIVERGSSHIVYQNDILQEEYDKFGIKGELPNHKIIDRELLEYEETDYISVPSMYVKQTFLEKGYPEKKIIHVPYGVNIGSFRKISKDDDLFRVIYCGGLTLRKGVQYLLQAFSELNLPKSELWLIGSITKEIVPLLKRYFSKKIKHLGPFPQSVLYKYYSQGSVFCLASIEEGLAMVQAQAMACSLPVICTTNTGCSDIVRNNIDGFIIPIRNVDAIKEKIIYLYENPDICLAMGESAYNRVSSGFSWSDYGKKMLMYYENILEQK